MGNISVDSISIIIITVQMERTKNILNYLKMPCITAKK